MVKHSEATNVLQICGVMDASAPVVVTFEAASYDDSDMAFPVKGSCRRGDEIKVGWFCTFCRPYLVKF